MVPRAGAALAVAAVIASTLALYTGTESERKPVTETEQAAQLTRAVQLAYCQPGVAGFFNFELRDDVDRSGWQSGLVRPDWTAKPAFAAYVAAIAAARQGAVDCSQVRK